METQKLDFDSYDRASQYLRDCGFTCGAETETDPPSEVWYRADGTSVDLQPSPEGGFVIVSPA